MRKQKLHEFEILGKRVKVGDILYARESGCPFGVENIRAMTIDEGIFGSKETRVFITVRNHNSGKKIELGEWHMTLFK